MPDFVPRRQRCARLEAFQLNSRTGPGPQQPIGCLAQFRASLGGVAIESGVERCEKDGDIAIDPFSKRPIDKRATFSAALPLAGGAIWSRIVHPIGLTHRRSIGPR